MVALRCNVPASPLTPVTGDTFIFSPAGRGGRNGTFNLHTECIISQETGNQGCNMGYTASEKKRYFLSPLAPTLGSQPSKEQEEDVEISEDLWMCFPLTQKPAAILNGSALTEAVLAPPFTNHRRTNSPDKASVHCLSQPPAKPVCYEKQEPHGKINT